MSEPSEETRRLLRAYRAETAPDQATREHALRGLVERTARGQLPATGCDIAPGQVQVPGPLLGVGTAGLLKGAALFVSAGVAGLWWQAAEPKPVERQATSEQPVVPTSQPVPEARALPTVQALAAPEAQLVRQVAEPTQAHTPRKRRQPEERLARPPAPKTVLDRSVPAPADSSLTLPAAPRPGEARPATSQLDEEMALMRRAAQASRRGDHTQALREVEAHEARFPAGGLAETRDVTRIVLLCDLGRVAEAKAQAAKFLRERPNSPFSAKVAAVCRTRP